MSVQEMINTPGYYYSLAYWLAAFIVTCTNEKRIQGIKRYVTHLIFLAAIVGFMEITDGVRTSLFLPCMLVSVSLFLIYIYRCCQFSLAEAGYYCARAFISGEFAASFGWQIYYYAVKTFQINHVKSVQWVLLVIVYAVIFGILYLLEKYLQKGGKEMHINRRELFTVLIITAAVFAVSNLSYIDKDSPFSSQFAAEMFIIRTLVDMSGMAVLYAYHIQVRELQMKFEVDTLQNILQMQYKNYQLSQESIEIVNQKYHDLKHQIALLKSEAGSRKSVEYLEKMEKEIKIYEAQNKTGKQQDAGGTTLQRVQGILPEQRSGILRILLRLLPARSLSALFGHLYRKRPCHQRRDRQVAPCRHLGPAFGQKRRSGGILRFVHIRHGESGRLL